MTPHFNSKASLTKNYEPISSEDLTVFLVTSEPGNF